MSQKKNILVPVDLSGNSESAIRYAAELSNAPDTKIYLFHSAVLPEFYVAELSDYNLYHKELKSAVKKICDASLSFLNASGKADSAVTWQIQQVKRLVQPLTKAKPAGTPMPELPILCGGKNSEN